MNNLSAFSYKIYLCIMHDSSNRDQLFSSHLSTDLSNEDTVFCVRCETNDMT
jgi:hypothetical protein